MVGLILVGGIIFSVGASAQKETAPNKVKKIASAKKESDKSAAKSSVAEPVKSETNEIIAADKPPAPNAQKDDKNQRTETLSETEAAIIPYYNSYMKEYWLGPQDVISVEVFDQCPDYCKGAITVPPTARISYPLIKEGVFVGGKTIYEVQEDIKKSLTNTLSTRRLR